VRSESGRKRNSTSGLPELGDEKGDGGCRRCWRHLGKRHCSTAWSPLAHTAASGTPLLVPVSSQIHVGWGRREICRERREERPRDYGKDCVDESCSHVWRGHVTPCVCGTDGWTARGLRNKHTIRVRGLSCFWLVRAHTTSCQLTCTLAHTIFGVSHLNRPTPKILIFCVDRLRWTTLKMDHDFLWQPS
jgi:hypothetical protein